MKEILAMNILTNYTAVGISQSAMQDYAPSIAKQYADITARASLKRAIQYYGSNLDLSTNYYRFDSYETKVGTLIFGQFDANALLEKVDKWNSEIRLDFANRIKLAAKKLDTQNNLRFRTSELQLLDWATREMYDCWHEYSTHTVYYAESVWSTKEFHTLLSRHLMNKIHEHPEKWLLLPVWVSQTENR